MTPAEKYKIFHEYLVEYLTNEVLHIIEEDNLQGSDEDTVDDIVEEIIVGMFDEFSLDEIIRNKCYDHDLIEEDAENERL